MNSRLSKTAAQLRALAGAWRERADNETNPNRAEHTLRTARELDEKALDLEGRGVGTGAPDVTH